MAQQKAARKFSFGAPQETSSRPIRGGQSRSKDGSDNTIKIESKAVIFLGKRQSAMRPGTMVTGKSQGHQTVGSKATKKESSNNEGRQAQGVRPRTSSQHKIFEIIPGDDDDEDYDGPQRHLSSFILFSQEFRPVLKQRFPNLTTHQIKQAVGKQWSQLTEDQRAPFEEMSKSDTPRMESNE